MCSIAHTGGSRRRRRFVVVVVVVFAAAASAIIMITWHTETDRDNPLFGSEIASSKQWQVCSGLKQITLSI